MKQKAGRKPRLQLAVVDRGRPRTARAFVARVVRTTLAFGRRPAMPVSLLLTDDAEMATLHGDWLDDATPTDVMSFALDGEAELVVSVTTARDVARRLGHAVRAEVALYIVHGLLHVLGYDDTTKAARLRMRAAERVVMKRLGLVVTPVDARR